MSGRLLTTAVDLQNVLIMLDGLFRLVILDQSSQLLQGVEIQLLHMRPTPIDPQRRTWRRAGQKIAVIQCDGLLKLLTASERSQRTLERLGIIVGTRPHRQPSLLAQPRQRLVQRSHPNISIAPDLFPESFDGQSRRASIEQAHQ